MNALTTVRLASVNILKIFFWETLSKVVEAVFLPAMWLITFRILVRKTTLVGSLTEENRHFIQALKTQMREDQEEGSPWPNMVTYFWTGVIVYVSWPYITGQVPPTIWWTLCVTWFTLAEFSSALLMLAVRRY